MITLETRPTMIAPFPAHSHARPVTSILVVLGCAMLSGILQWGSFFPLNLGFLSWFALVPLLLLVRANTSPWKWFLAAWAGGLLHFGLSLKWVPVAHPMMFFAWIALSFYCALYFPLAITLLRRIDRLNVAPLTITVPIVWITLEYLRAHFMTGFAWYFLGHTQHDNLVVVQIADLGGVYAVSLVIAAVNGFLFECLCRWLPLPAWLNLAVRRQGAPFRAIRPAVPVLLVLATVVYGVWRTGQKEFSAGPRVTILQSNIDQGTRNARDEEPASGESPSDLMMKELARLTSDGLKQPASDLMIWPETTCPMDYVIPKPASEGVEFSTRFREMCAEREQMLYYITRYSKTNVLLGLNCREYATEDSAARFNSALLVRKDGKVLDRYDKMHCVMFGEFVPMRKTFPWMKVFTPYDHDYSITSGERYTRFELPTAERSYRFGTLICYEDSDPLLARRYARADAPDAPAVDFLINITNDGWFDGTEEHEQHLAISRFRAIESRRALVRSVNMGISAVIDGNGRVIALPGPNWSNSKKMAAAFSATVPIDARVSFYALAGDWLPVACAVFAALGLLLTVRRRDESQERIS